MSLLAPACAAAAGLKKWCPATARAVAPLAALNAVSFFSFFLSFGFLKEKERRKEKQSPKRQALSLSYFLKPCPSSKIITYTHTNKKQAGVVTALAGTGALSVPLFITLRRLSAAASMAADRIALGKAPPRQAVLASGVMAAGAALAALTEARSSGLAFGCAAVLANAGLTAWYLARLRQRVVWMRYAPKHRVM